MCEPGVNYSESMGDRKRDGVCIFEKEGGGGGEDPMSPIPPKTVMDR